MCLYVSVTKTLDLFFNIETAVDRISGINLCVRGEEHLNIQQNQIKP